MSERLDGELDDRTRARVDRHLAGCRRCAKVLDSLRRTLDLLRAAGDSPSTPAASVADEVLGLIRRDLDLGGGR